MWKMEATPASLELSHTQRAKAGGQQARHPNYMGNTVNPQAVPNSSSQASVHSMPFVLLDTAPGEQATHHTPSFSKVLKVTPRLAGVGA